MVPEVAAVIEKPISPLILRLLLPLTVLARDSCSGEKMHPGSDSGSTETYMMPGVGTIPNATMIPPLAGTELMGNELHPEYTFERRPNYPAANHYGYLCPAYESPGEWGDHHGIFGLDGQDLHYMGLQAESLPYVYYSPGYVYAQSPFNQYTSYVPGAVTGLDGSILGTQHYLSSPSYQPPISSPACIPVIVQPSSDFVTSRSMDPFLFGTSTSVATRPANASTKVPTQASVSVAAASQLATSMSPSLMLDTSQPLHKNLAAFKPSEGSQFNIQPSNQSSSHESMMHVSGTNRHQSHGTVAGPSYRGLTNWQPNVFGWASQDEQRRRLRSKDDVTDGGRHPHVLEEQNKECKNRLKDQTTSSGVELAGLSQISASDVQGGCIIISPDDYNKDDFPVNYPDAKFFVIKSYSEDDVHKSIKYNVWSSTPNGNKRLNSAYEDAQRKSAGKSRKCPVNASGQFCGLAEMVGLVDFDKDMDFWQQDKWCGSFPVKWHIIKDVPNASLRHIILENNENKPVTNSRDTQEIPYSAGINMLSIFKTSLLRTSILDDFMFYEVRQKKMLEDKIRHFGRSYTASLQVPAAVAQSGPDGKADHPPRVGENHSSAVVQISQAVEYQTDDAAAQPLKSREKMQDESASRPSKIDGKHSGVAVDQSQRTDGKQLSPAVSLPFKADGNSSTDTKDLPFIAGGMQSSETQIPMGNAKSEPAVNSAKLDEKQRSLVTNQLPKSEIKPPSFAVSPREDGMQAKQKIEESPKPDGNLIRPNDVNGGGQAKTGVHSSESSADKDFEPYLSGDAKDTNAIVKAGMRSVDPKQGTTMALEVIPPDVVKVGSMQIKVDLGESPSKVMSVRAKSTEFKGPRLHKKGLSRDRQQRPTK
ncbi:YT521-B-like domain [Musa troglodytarum]|uniref:YT521-B-like domain n=1 Tax=Musa troglodytarum TaxID=320322 RepID=A0A9E7KW44_9LILI|nr:YT521-B-like domain [Musa troglodytarum]